MKGLVIKITLFVVLLNIILCAKQGPYEILGLKKGANKQQVKQAFRKLSLQYHPDKNKDPRADAKYKTITEAYQKIIDGNADADYNPENYGGNPYQQNYGGQGGYQYYTYTSNSGSGRTTYTYYQSSSPNQGDGRNKQKQRTQQERFDEYKKQYDDQFNRNSRYDPPVYQRSDSESYLAQLMNVLGDPMTFQIIIICMVFALLQIVFSMLSGDLQGKRQNDFQKVPPTAKATATNNQNPHNPTPQAENPTPYKDDKNMSNSTSSTQKASYYSDQQNMRRTL